MVRSVSVPDPLRLLFNALIVSPSIDIILVKVVVVSLVPSLSWLKYGIDCLLPKK